MVKQHVARVREDKQVNQLIHFLRGAVGVGKTFLVTALRHCINRSLNRPSSRSAVLISARGLAALGTNLWKDLVSFSELTDVVRSKGDTTFTALCHRIRTGKQTSDDIELLKTRVISKLPPIKQLME